MSDELIFQIIDWQEYNDRADVETELIDYKTKLPRVIHPTRYYINMYGRTQDEKSVCLRVEDFKPYFFVEIPESWSPTYINAFIRLLNSLLIVEKINGSIIKDDEYNENETIELQWRTVVDNVKNSGIIGNSLSVIDLSGSMFSASNGSIPAQVAIALGIITSQCCNGMFKNKFITFSDKPELVSLIPDELYKEYTEKGIEPSLYTCFKSLIDVDFGYNTDFVKCCESIIKYGLDNNIKDEDMPRKLFIFTDMQFDEANVDSENKCVETVYKTIVKRFKAVGYTPPKFIFWNLNSGHKESFPVNCKTEGTAMISGFSEQLLKIFMSYDEFNADLIVNEILAPYIKEIVIDDSEI